MKIKALRRLHSRKGESIAETLIALLVSALALVMLAGAISTAGSLIRKSETIMERYYAGLSVLGNPVGDVLEISLTDEKDKPVYLGIKEESTEVKSAVNDAFQSRPVMAYCVDRGAEP